MAQHLHFWYFPPFLATFFDVLSCNKQIYITSSSSTPVWGVWAWLQFPVQLEPPVQWRTPASNQPNHLWYKRPGSPTIHARLLFQHDWSSVYAHLFTSSSLSTTATHLTHFPWISFFLVSQQFMCNCVHKHADATSPQVLLVVANRPVMYAILPFYLFC